VTATTLAITTQKLNGTTVLALEGRLTIGDACAAFHQSVRQHISQGDNRIVLDMAKVTYVDSSGLSELVGALVAARRENGDLQLTNITRRLQELLEVSRVYSVFQLVGHNIEPKH
jgi:anti-sigma B factor antagonist